MRWAGLALLGLAVFKLIAVDTIMVIPVAVGFIPVLNAHFLTGALVVALVSVLAWRFLRQAHDLIGYESYAFVALVVTANFVALWTLNQEVIHYFDSQAAALERATPIPWDQVRAATNAKYLSMTYLWALYGAVVIAVSVCGGACRSVRWAGLAILALASLKLMAFDTFMTELVSKGFMPFLNWHFLAFALLQSR